jgi:[acyl-carrier-protein] S-malonyltransferase
MSGMAFLFPGQGSQGVGMGKDFYDYSSQAREIFLRAEKKPGWQLGIVWGNIRPSWQPGL